MDKSESRRLLALQPEVRELLAELMERRCHLAMSMLGLARVTSDTELRAAYAMVTECDRAIVMLGGKSLHDQLKEVHRAD